MEPNDELAQERARRIKLEEELAAWHGDLAKNLKPEALASTILKQQVDTLAFHLLQTRRLAADLDAKLKAKERELAAARDGIRSLESEVERLRKPAASVQKPGAAWMPTDEELDSIVSSGPAKPADAQKKRGDTRSFREFIQLMKRMGRIKLYDAALLMDTTQEEVMAWAEMLEKKDYLRIQRQPDKVLVATDRLRNIR